MCSKSPRRWTTVVAPAVPVLGHRLVDHVPADHPAGVASGHGQDVVAIGVGEADPISSSRWKASGTWAYQIRVWPSRPMPWARAKAAMRSGASKRKEPSGWTMYSIFISHSGVSWLTSRVSRATRAGSSRCEGLEAGPDPERGQRLQWRRGRGWACAGLGPQALRARAPARTVRRAKCPAPALWGRLAPRRRHLALACGCSLRHERVASDSGYRRRLPPTDRRPAQAQLVQGRGLQLRRPAWPWPPWRPRRRARIS